MRLVVDEVLAGGVPRVATAAAARWSGNDPAHVRTSANHVFRFLRGGRPYYLRLTPGSEREADAIRSELDFVLHAAATGLAVARPLPSTSSGDLVEEVVDDEGRRYHAVVFRALRGRQHDWDELDEAMVGSWGRTLAHLHRASETFPVRDTRASWSDEIRAALETLPEEETAVAGVLRAGLAWLDAQPMHEYGLLHGDFELDNLFWEGGRAHMLDFDGAVYGWYGVDVAVALADVWREGGADRERRLAWFFDGYSAVRPLPPGTRAMLPRLVTLSSALKMAGLLRMYAGTRGVDAPDWVATMHARHQRWLAARRAELQAD
jgi:Ser/Thr protein kinase RdoA (MazF antagonist)